METEEASSSPALSLTEKETVPSVSCGCAAAWQWVGSIDLNLLSLAKPYPIRPILSRAEHTPCPGSHGSRRLCW